MNAYECVRMRQNTPRTTHTYTRKKPSGLKAKLTWTGMGWTGCGRAIRRAIRAPMCHYKSSKSSSSDSSPSPSSSTYAEECIRMQTNANGYIWMQTNAYTSEHTLVNASAYTSECVCEWMHLNALECVRMRVRQNATCRQNAPYVGRHLNTFECNSCRMQRTANAQ